MKTINEKEEVRRAAGGANPAPEQKMDQHQNTEKKVEEFVENGLKLPNITITGIRKMRDKDVGVFSKG